MSESLSLPEQKRRLRQAMRRARRALSRSERTRAGKRLARLGRRLILKNRHPRVALYFSHDSEIPTGALIQTLLEHGAEVYLPVLHPVYHNRLWFARYTPETPMVRNTYGIAEPDIRRAGRVPPWTLSQVCLPLVAFDEKGYRLGMGGGYYDRTFDRARPMPKRPRLTGLAYEFQRQAHIPREPWDVPLEAVVTDQQIRLFRPT
ncbi:MAG: 5-formyltetrahydrofolate cyclo-ligase [Gammaproteobacteria bacterium]|nr:MAG: 5-formyltetrahydrofolate cyclo-ligase [Gammaproteobacteria bacterium]